MSHEKEQDKEKRSTTDPQEDEKDGNVFGEAFDKLTGNAAGNNSLSEAESKDPGNQESIKDGGKDKENN